MANINMDLIKVGQEYNLAELADLWGYKSYMALRKGVITPKNRNLIILLVIRKNQPGTIQYENSLQGNILYMMGQEKHGTDKRLLKNLNTKKDEIHLFYKEKHHTPFIYYGKCFLIGAEIKQDSPSEFQFLIENAGEVLESESDIIDYLINIPLTTGESNSLFVEGRKCITSHVRYERNPHNRKEAIRIHGHKCKICGFDFDEVYGNELADSYIEIHHIKQLAEGEQLVDPAKDLIPVCANCHRMLHRKRNNNISVSVLAQNDRLKKYSEMISRGFEQ